MSDPADDPGFMEAALASFRQSPVLSLVMEGPDFEIVAANDLVSDFVGGDRGWIGRPYREAFSDVLGQGYVDLLERVYESGDPSTLREWRVEYQLPDGGTLQRYINLFVTPWRTAAGVRGVIGQGIDVTEEVVRRKRAEVAEAASEVRVREARELVLALQDSLLPHTLPVVSGLQTAGRYLLAEDDTAAGGDWLDVIPLEDGHVMLVVGDVVGHGVAASALMGQLRAILGERLASGAGIVDSLAALDRVAGRTPEAHAATVVVAEVDPASGGVSYCTAGHPPPLVLSDGEARFLAPSGAQPLATGGGFVVAEEQLAPGDQLLLYSDGLIERPGRTPAQATVELSTVAGRVARGEAFRPSGEPAVDEVCEHTLELLTRETGYADDITVLALQRVPSPEPLEITGQAQPDTLTEVRGAVASWLAPLAVRPLDEMAVLHVVGECVTNVIDHAYRDRPEAHDRPLHVTGTLGTAGTVTLTVSDRGSWRYGARDGSGRGLQMVNTMADHAAIDRHPDGTTVTLTCPVSRSVTLMQGGSGSGRPASNGEFGTDRDDGLLRVRGPVDTVSADEFRTVLLRLTGGRLPEVRVDLTEVTLLASAGVQVLYDARARAEEQGIALRLLAAPGSTAHYVLALVGLPCEPPRGADDGSVDN